MATKQEQFEAVSESLRQLDTVRSLLFNAQTPGETEEDFRSVRLALFEACKQLEQLKSKL